MNKMKLFEWIERDQRTIRMILAPILIILVGGVYGIVYMTGGIKFVYSHSMYIPILLSGIVFGIKGGAFVGLLGGFVLGPFMPIDVVTGEMQRTLNWLYRTGFFTLIGFLSGAASDSAKSYIKHLKWLSRHDTYTQLPNRIALFDKLSKYAVKKHAPDSLVLAVISIENSMELKSAFGFDVIEEAVRQMAKRIEKNFAGRGIYLTATAQIGVLITKKMLDALLDASRRPLLYNGISIHIDTRMGTAELGQALEEPEYYLKTAEAALVVAQEKGEHHVAYGPEIKTVVEDNMIILGELENAIKTGQLSLHYQPKIHISTGAVHGAEALMRWHHPERGNISPNIFIPRAEQSMLIQSITEFALDQTMGQMVRWRKDNIDLPIAVNVSTRNLLHPGFNDFILGLLDQYGLHVGLLELEVTEGALMMDVDRAVDELAQLNKLKIVISIDDFGTGYSSLQYLHRLPISFIKVDQSFVRRLTVDKGAAYIVEAAVVLAHKMGIKVIAEGVESKAVYDFLGNIGCDIAQGFMISRPLPAEEFAKWYIQHQGKY